MLFLVTSKVRRYAWPLFPMICRSYPEMVRPIMGDLWTPMCLRNYHRPSLEDALVPNEAPCAPTEGRGERCPGTKKRPHSSLAVSWMDN